jgi:flagellar secretion chaperone FliS
MIQNPWKSYQQVATKTASPGQLTLMLFDGVIRFLEQARHGFTMADPIDFNQTINNNVLRAQAIINELNYALNMEQGGEVAIVLRRLYVYFDRRLLQSNIQKDPAGIEEVLARITTLRNAWMEMLNQMASGKAQWNSAAGSDSTESLCAVG